MSTFTAWWLRRVAKNHIIASVLLFALHRQTVVNHYVRRDAKRVAAKYGCRYGK